MGESFGVSYLYGARPAILRVSMSEAALRARLVRTM
jgi:hypothetical protein